MKILYHLPVLPPKLPAAEALSQEIEALRSIFAGEINIINPNQQTSLYIPRLLFGFHQLRRLRAEETAVDLHHFYNPDPFPYPIWHFVRRPVVYSISSGLGEKRPFLPYFRRMAAVTVYDERSLHRLQQGGLPNVHLVRSGVDTTRFTHTPVPLTGNLRLLVASAPWTTAQFQTKGIDTLLTTAQQLPSLHLIFLWRGVLVDAMRQRVQQSGLSDRVQVINRLVDVNEVLAMVHGTVNLAMETAVIKAYPHSLLDSLAAGKPVITSRNIAMSDYVDKVGCGLVVEQVTSDAIMAAIDQFVQQYAGMVETAVHVGQHHFTQEKMVDSFRKVYQSARG